MADMSELEARLQTRVRNRFLSDAIDFAWWEDGWMAVWRVSDPVIAARMRARGFQVVEAGAVDTVVPDDDHGVEMLSRLFKVAAVLVALLSVAFVASKVLSGGVQ